MKKLQAQLNPLAENNCERLAVVLEGRDTAGKSSTIRAVTEYLNPAWYSIVPSTKPSASTMNQWLSYWATKFPNKGQMVFYGQTTLKCFAVGEPSIIHFKNSLHAE